MPPIDNSKRTEILIAQEKSQTFEKRLTESDSEFVENRRNSPVMDDDDFNKLLIKTDAEFSKVDKTAPIEEQRSQFAKAVKNATKNISDDLDRTFISNKTLSEEQLALLDAVRTNAIPGREEEIERLRLEEQKKAFEKTTRSSQAAATARLARERQQELLAIQQRTETNAETAEQLLIQREQLVENVADIKARIRPFPAQAQQIYGTEDATKLPTIMSILDGRHGGTNGVIFPYTPIIQYMPTTEYAKYDPVHTNTDYQTYHRTQAVQLQVSGQFTAQSPKEAVYCLAVIHFLRTVTKMRFGRGDDRRGEPPPLLLFDCYGWYMFNRLPVIITGFSLPYEKDIDYIPVDTRPFFGDSSLNNNTFTDFDRHVPSKYNDPNITWVPANFTISISMYVQIQPKVWRKGFDLEKFRTGELFSEKNSVNVFGKGSNKNGSIGGGWI